MNQSNEFKHTPTPWLRSSYGVWAENTRIASCQPDDGTGVYKVTEEAEAVANAEFIVRAVNSHEELLLALKFALENLELSQKHLSELNVVSSVPRAIALSRKAIAKAETK